MLPPLPPTSLPVFHPWSIILRKFDPFLMLNMSWPVHIYKFLLHFFEAPRVTLTLLCWLLSSLLCLAGLYNKLSQMPIILVPLHFDRDPIMHHPSCQRSVAIRTFMTNDFMTGVPALPGKDIPEKVSIVMLLT